MAVKDTVRRQYTRLADLAAQQVDGLQLPKEGWIAVIRKALGMSGPQLAKRVGVTRAAIYQAERSERNGAITLKQMEKIARALGGKLVYAIVPDGQIEDIVRIQARNKAENIVNRASSHMALEKQSLPPEKNLSEIERLTETMVRDLSSDLWDEM